MAQACLRSVQAPVHKFHSSFSVGRYGHTQSPLGSHGLALSFLSVTKGSGGLGSGTGRVLRCLIPHDIGVPCSHL
jgi:hypothetical protein